MGEEGNATNLAASKLCDSCKSATASLFCRNDSAFLCIPCDSKIHAANKVASRHARVLMCEVCQRAPAHVTCKVDAAALCVACDRDIHSANPLACRHERFPVVPFYDSVVRVSNYHQNYLNTCEAADEEEAASWLMPNLNAKIDDPDRNQPHVNFTIYAEVDPYRDLDIGPKECLNEAQISSVADGVVPEHCKNGDARVFLGNGGVADDCFDVGLTEPYKGFPYFGAANGNSINHSVSSSSHEVGVVPDSVSNPFGGQSNSFLAEVTAQAVPLFGAEREAKVLRYQEKRKNRKFEKTIRYASRKAYAETRPRIKGRFAKRTENDAAAVDDQIYDMDSPAVRNSAAGYLVPTY